MIILYGLGIIAAFFSLLELSRIVGGGVLGPRVNCVKNSTKMDIKRNGSSKNNNKK